MNFFETPVKSTLKGALFVSSMLMSFEVLASTTGSVGSPNVKEGNSTVAFRLGYSDADETSSDDDRLRARFHYDYGITDYYAIRLQVAGDDRKGDTFEHESISLVNRFHILRKEDYGFDAGFRVGYTMKDGDKKADSVTFGLYQLFPYDAWEFRFNELFEHDVGEESVSGTSFALRSQATYKISDTHRLGIEMFNDFDNLREEADYEDQNHTIGPVLKGKMFGDISYETGYRVGISNSAPDHSFKFFIEKSF